MRLIVLALQALVLISSIGSQTRICAATLKDVRASRRANVNGGSVHYEVYGQGTPLVFVHAGLADSRMWDPQINYFSRKHTIVRFDARGYGQSDPPTGPYAPADDLFA